MCTYRSGADHFYRAVPPACLIQAEAEGERAAAGASITARDTGARTAGAQASASITASGALARTAGARASARQTVGQTDR